MAGWLRGGGGGGPGRPLGGRGEEGRRWLGAIGPLVGGGGGTRSERGPGRREGPCLRLRAVLGAARLLIPPRERRARGASLLSFLFSLLLPRLGFLSLSRARCSVLGVAGEERAGRGEPCRLRAGGGGCVADWAPGVEAGGRRPRRPSPWWFLP